MYQYYVFKEETNAKGYYEECLHDEAPQVGTYTKDIDYSFKRGKILAISDDYFAPGRTLHRSE